MTIYGYARVSGTSQDLDGQIAELKEKGNATAIYHEKVTGTSTKDRTEFKRLLGDIGAGDTLVVTKLDRFARSAEDAITTIKALVKRDVRVHILNMGIVEDTPAGRLMLTILAGFAEFERDMIVERLAEGKAIARQREDYREGRPRKYSREQINHAMKLLEEHSYTKVAEMTGISKATLTRYKRKMKEQAGGN